MNNKIAILLCLLSVITISLFADDTPLYNSINVITGEYVEISTDLKLTGPNGLALQRSFHGQDGGWRFNHPHVLQHQEYDEKPSDKYEYEYDDSARLVTATSRNLQTRQATHYLAFNYSEGSEGAAKVCRVQSDDNRTVTYYFDTSDHHRNGGSPLLYRVEGPGGSYCQYTYMDHPIERNKLIKRKEMPDGRYLETHYYKGKNNDVGGVNVHIENPARDGRIGRVKLQKAPVGTDNKPVTTAKFFYYTDYTDVINSQGQKTRYHYSDEGLITAVETYINEHGSGETLYKRKRYFWEDRRLVSKTLEDSNGNIFSCETYSYDGNHNLAAKKLYGNISGSKHAAIKLDQKGQPVNLGEIDCAQRTYNWGGGKDHSLLLSQTDENGTTTQLRYNDAQQQTAMLVCDAGGSIKIRQFYLYDERGLLIETINDDGNSDDPANLSGVTERRMARFTLRSSAPAIEMPETIAEYCLDLKTGNEQLLRKTVNHYSHYGQIIQQDIYDADDNFSYSLHNDYDEAGRCISSTDAAGNRTEWQYDANGNKVVEYVITANGEEKMCCHTYDYANRLIHTEETAGGKTSHSRFLYDTESRLIRATDNYGNETHYEYDPLGRVVQTRHPVVVNGDDIPVRPTIKQKHDLFGNAVETTDPLGYKTKSTYNIKGKPVRIEYADGTEERYVYGMDGSITEEVSRTGLKTTYIRDYLGRPTKKEVYSNKGRLVEKVKMEYSAFHKTKESTLSPAVKKYCYDAAGRLKCVKIEDNGTEVRRKEYAYNALGQVSETKEWYGNSSKDYVVTVTDRDVNDNVLELRVLDANGTIMRQRRYNTTEKQQDERTVVKAFAFDRFAADETAPIERSIDDHGNVTVTIYDAMGRTESIIRKDAFGEVSADIQYRYDAAGNKVRELHTNYRPGGSQATYKISWKYGPNNRVESITENDARTTEYHYNAQGMVEKIAKPDGTIITHCYHSDGNLKSMTSSDGTVDYHYVYDDEGRIKEVYDAITNTATKRKYDACGQLLQEQLGNGLTIRNNYDKMGRRTAVQLPDKSAISYHYDASFLKEVHRYDSNNQLQYTHAYSNHDLEGRPIETTLICGLGKATYAYSPQQTPTSIDTPYWSAAFDENSFTDDGLLRSITIKDSIGEWQDTYEHDSKRQLTKEDGHAYTYDTMGNRYEDNKTIAYNNHHELTAHGEQRLTYDGNGNVTAIEDQALYTYDALNRLIRVKKDRTVATYTYDAFHRRISKKVVHGGTVTTEHYLYDGDREIGAANDKGELRELRVLGAGYGAEYGAAVAMELEGRTYAPIHDHLGSVRCLVDAETRQTVDTYRYSAFGEETIYNESGTPLSPWRYASKRCDEESGLIYFGKRYYAPHWGRWLTQDPLGFADGPNRYAYLHNNPLTNRDLYGLFSCKEFFTKMASTFVDCVRTVGIFVRNTINSLRTEINLIDYFHPVTTALLEDLFGSGFLRLNGYYVHPLETGIFGEGELNDSVRITMLNGIDNVRSYFKDSLEQLISSHGGNNVHYIFRPTQGWTFDILNAFFIKCGYVSPYARQLAATWKQLIQEMGGTESGSTIIHYSHSLGGPDTMAAAMLLTEEERAMIQVYTIGSPTLIPDNLGFQSVTNYVSVLDGVPLFDPYRYFKSLFFPEASNVQRIGSYLGLPLCDHSMCNDTYSNLLSSLGTRFVEMYGS